MRTTFAAIVGYVIFAASAVAMFHLTGHDPHEGVSNTFKVISTIGGIVAALIGGYVAARIAHTASGGTGVALLIAVIAAISALATRGSGTLWSQVAALCTMAPAAYVGGRISRPGSGRAAYH